jgi:Fe-S cluster assembly protein SufD
MNAKIPRNEFIEPTLNSIQMSNIEKSYIDIYRDCSSAIKKDCPDVLNACRDEAMCVFERMGLPSCGLENYRHTDLSKRFETDFGLDINRLGVKANPYTSFRCDVPGINSHLFFVVNDIFCEETDEAKAEIEALRESGVIVGSLLKCAAEYPEIVGKYYGKAADVESDSTVAFNTAFAKDGLFLYVPENVAVEKPIQLVNVMSASLDLMANSRNLIILEKGASAKLLVCGHTNSKVKFLANRVTEVFVNEGAVYEHYKLENTNDSMTNIGSLFIEQQAESNVLVNDITLHNGLTRNNVRINLNGEHAETVLCGMAIGDKKEHIDNFTYINHAKSNCNSRELYKYVLNDEATGVFAGRILVDKDSQKTVALQNNKNICGSATAKMYTKPQLEIYADDVKCSHGATVGQIDETALFYLRARGISEKEAKMLLMLAFTDDVIENIRLEALKTKIRHLVESRFRGESSKCNGCDICK